MTVTTNEPDRLVVVGITHHLELHGVREQVYNYAFLAEGGENLPEYIEKTAVDFVFRAPGTPSAMLDASDAQAVRDWLTAWLTPAHPTGEENR
ncbi:MAG: hypothetical protein K0Q52_154 [Microbacterium sp.]|jgi:hypothetical protein|nr:hypothetical protein [Microbacterium sp.]